jgi:hypothetical protein
MTERSTCGLAAVRQITASPRALRSTCVFAVASLAGLLQLIAPAASAHHSFAMYDTKIVRTLTGRLVQFVPGANHAQLIFEVLDADGAVSVDANGEPVLWGVETGPAAQIARRGVTLEHFAVGTVMTVTLNPLRDGRNFGALAREGGHVIHCGAQLPPHGCTASTGTVFLAD